jgi:hypothetical protein
MGWQVASVAFGLLALLFGIFWWRAATRKSTDLGKTAQDLARDSLETKRREARDAIDTAHADMTAEIERKRQDIAKEANRDDSDLDILGRPRR